MSTRTAVLAVVVAAGVAATACSGGRPPSGGAGSPSPPPASSSAPSPNRLDPPRVDKRAYPFTQVDIRRTPVSAIEDPDVNGPPPRIPWTEPTWTSTIVHTRGSSLRLPRWGLLGGTLGRRLVLDGGCTRAVDRCGSRPGGGVHLLGPDGVTRSVDPVTRAHDVRGVVTSVTGEEIAWLADHPAGSALFHYARGDSVATELPSPDRPGSRAAAVPVGFVGPRDVLVHHGGRTPYYTRSSGRPAPWNARWLSPVAPGVLVGEPGFTPRRERCLSLFTADTRRPRWTRCYRSGEHAAHGFDDVSMAPGGRLLLTTTPAHVVLLDARTGRPVHRLLFEDRVQDVAFEDRSHVLVLLDASDSAADEWPLQRIVRCRVDLRCEETMSPVRIGSYDSLGLVPPGSAGW